MKVLISATVRGIVTDANEMRIKKEDIVSLVKDKEQYILVYYN